MVKLRIKASGDVGLPLCVLGVTLGRIGTGRHHHQPVKVRQNGGFQLGRACVPDLGRWPAQPAGSKALKCSQISLAGPVVAGGSADARQKFLKSPATASSQPTPLIEAACTVTASVAPASKSDPHPRSRSPPSPASTQRVHGADHRAYAFFLGHSEPF